MVQEKKINKVVKFVYYQGYLIADPDKVKQNKGKWNALFRIKNILSNGKELTEVQQALLADEALINAQKELYEKYGRSVWDAEKTFEHVVKEGINTNIDIGDMIVEIEPGTLVLGDELISFQLTKLRDNMLPAKKKIGTTKEDIPLDDDEYIGEFTSILYDKRNSVFMIQTNMHGVSYGQVAKYLTLLRRRVIDTLGTEDFYDAACELSVVVNTCDLDNIRSSQEVKKLRVRAADGVFNSFETDENNFLGKIRKSFKRKSGIIIDVTVSIDRETDVKSLDEELIEDVIGNYDLIKNCEYDKNLLVEITRKENEDVATEVINLLRPKMTDEINLKLKPRTSVMHKDLLKEMKKVYNKSRIKVNKSVGE